MDNKTELLEEVLKLDRKLERQLRTGWPESWLQLNLPLGSTRALLVIEGGYANTPKGVAEILGVTRTNVTWMLDRLEAEGLITRQVDANDRRSFRLELTEKGYDLIYQIENVRREQLAQALQLMDVTAIEALQTGLNALTQAMQSYIKSSSVYKKRLNSENE